MPYQLQKARLAMLYMQFMFDETIQVNRHHHVMYKSMVEAGVLRGSLNNQVRMAELYDAVERWVDLAANMEKAILLQNAKPTLDPIPVRESEIPSSWLEDPFVAQPVDESSPIKARIVNPRPSETKRQLGEAKKVMEEFRKLKARGLLYDPVEGEKRLSLLFRMTRQIVDRTLLREARGSKPVDKLMFWKNADEERLRLIYKFCKEMPTIVDLEEEEEGLLDEITTCIDNMNYGIEKNENVIDREALHLFVPVRLQDRRVFWMNLCSKDVLEWLSSNDRIETSKAMSKLLPEFKGANAPQQALDAGATESGCTVHLVTAEIDAGRILGQARVPVLPGDSADSLHERIKDAEHELLPRVLAEWPLRQA